MYLGLSMLIATATLNNSWNLSLVCTVVCQVLYSGISFYALHHIIKMRPSYNIVNERIPYRNDHSEITVEHTSAAYAPEYPDEGTIFIPPDPFYNYDNTSYPNLTPSENIITPNSSDSYSLLYPTYTETAKNLTDGLQYRISSQRTISAPNIYTIEKPTYAIDDNKDFYRRASSTFEDYGLSSNYNCDSIKYTKSSYSSQFFDINTTGAVSEYDVSYVQQVIDDDVQPLCNPYANMRSDELV